MHRNKVSLIEQNQQDAVLSKALVRLAAVYGLKGKELAQIIGISQASATRLTKGERLISQQSKEGELALLLIRLYRSLNVLVGNDPSKAKAWLTSQNHYFQEATPLERIKSIEGLIDVVNYLDALRGKT